jgi:hypothetical protein
MRVTPFLVLTLTRRRNALTPAAPFFWCRPRLVFITICVFAFVKFMFKTVEFATMHEPPSIPLKVLDPVELDTHGLTTGSHRADDGVEGTVRAVVDKPLGATVGCFLFCALNMLDFGLQSAILMHIHMMRKRWNCFTAHSSVYALRDGTPSIFFQSLQIE